MIWPDDSYRGINYEDTWVEANTWAVDMVEVAVMKYENTEEFDYRTQGDRFLYFGLIIFSEHFAPAEWVIFWLWFSQSIWFLLFPQAYIDEEGYAKPGWPEAIARTRDYMKILILDYEPFLGNRSGEKVRLSLFDFYQMILITLLNSLYGTINYLLYDIPYFISFSAVFIMYVFYWKPILKFWTFLESILKKK